MEWRVYRIINPPYCGVPPSHKNKDPKAARWVSALGHRVRTVRRAKGMTQERLAELSEIGPRTLQKLEAGEFTPLVTTIARIRAVLDCSFDDLLPS
jgi:DNA-binding XRE family transcriptional regulator